MNIEQEIRAQIEKNKGLKLAVGEINNHLSILEGLLRNERDDVQKQVDEAYQKGLDDAWDAARKIFGSNVDGGYCMEQIREILGKRSLFCTTDVIRQCTINEVIEKLKAYEEKQKAADEIKVGDEVRWGEDLLVVTRFYENGGFNWCDGISKDGRAFHVLAENVSKTNRRFYIESILREMNE